MGKEAIVLLDSHVLLWLASNPKRLSIKARSAIAKAERVVIPIIALFEIFWLLEKSKLDRLFPDVLTLLRERGYFVYPIDRAVLRTFLIVPKIEMHDRMIVATAMLVDGVIISRDSEIKRVYSRTIW